MIATPLTDRKWAWFKAPPKVEVTPMDWPPARRSPKQTLFSARFWPLRYVPHCILGAALRMSTKNDAANVRHP